MLLTDTFEISTPQGSEKMENITKVLGLARIRINLASYDSAPNFQWVKRVMLVENVVLFISLCSQGAASTDKSD